MPSFFFNDTATTEIYTLSLHDALPIWRGPQAGLYRGPQRHRADLPGRAVRWRPHRARADVAGRQNTLYRRWPDLRGVRAAPAERAPDRKSTRLNSSHSQISYAVFFF